jgi:hypothetical protein
MLLAGAGQGIQSVRPGVGPFGNALTGFSRGFILSNASRRAAEDYALKQQQAEEASRSRALDDKLTEARIEAMAKEKAPEPRKTPTNILDMTQQEFDLYRTRSGQLSQTTRPPKEPPEADAVSSLADAMHSMGYAALQGLGMGAAGLREAVVAEHARKYPNDDLAQISSNYRSLSGAQANLQRGVSASEGFAATAQNAMGLLDSTISSLPDTGIVPFNFVLRNIGRATGNEDITAFDNARQVVNTELGRILGQGFMSNGTQLTDSMRHEIREGMNPSATRGQLRAALRILRTDLGFKIQAGQGEIGKIRGQIGRGSPADSTDPFTGLYK